MKQVLENKTIVLTRNIEQCQEPTETLSGYGANVICFPCIKIVPLNDYSDLMSLLDQHKFDYTIFSSANAIEIFHEVIKETEYANLLDSTTNIAVGPKTKEKGQELGIKINSLPESYSVKGLLQMLSEYSLQGKNILIPSSIIARDELKSGLIELGANVFSVSVYTTVLPQKNDVEFEMVEMTKTVPDIYIFTSPSTFENFLKLLEISDPKEYFKNKVVTAIGTTTQEAIEKKDVMVQIIPEKFTMNSLIDKIIEYYNN